MASADTQIGAHPLEGIKALVFDVFGTVTDYFHTVSREILQRSRGTLTQEEAEAFTTEWRQGYITRMFAIARGEKHSLIVDEWHREFLDNMVKSPRWSALGSLWDEKEREEINMIWHYLDAWPDSSEGLYELKKHIIIATLSNGNVRLLVDMARHANLPWNAVLSSEFIGTTKPYEYCLTSLTRDDHMLTPILLNHATHRHKDMYQRGARYLSLEPHEVALVAAHSVDLRAAASAGLKTIYLPRSTEDTPEARAQVRSKAEGGEMDLVVSSIIELAQIVATWKQGQNDAIA